MKVVVPAPNLNVIRHLLPVSGSAQQLNLNLMDERGNFIVELIRNRFLIDSDNNPYYTTAIANRHASLALVGHYPKPIAYRGYRNPGPNQVPIFSLTLSTNIWHQENNAARSMQFHRYLAVQMAVRQVVGADLAYLYSGLSIRVPDYYYFHSMPMHNFSDGLDWFDWPNFKAAVLAYYENWVEEVVFEETDVEDDNPEAVQGNFEFFPADYNPRYSEWKDLLTNANIRQSRAAILQKWLPFAIHVLEGLSGKATMQSFEFPLALKAFGIFVGVNDLVTYDDKLAFSIIETTAVIPAQKGQVSLMAIRWKGKGKGEGLIFIPVSIPMSSERLGVSVVPPPEQYPKF
jgi:hypothetical protein